MFFKCTRCVFQVVCERRASSVSRPPPPLRLLFFGSDESSAIGIKRLSDYRQTLSPDDSPVKNFTLSDLQIVTAPSTRNNSALPRLARRLQIPLHRVPLSVPFSQWNDDFLNHFDVAVSMSFGLFIPREILSRFPLGSWNVHGSLLPAYRGAAPLRRALWAGERETGATLQELDSKKFDAGRIISQRSVTIAPNAMYSDVRDAVCNAGTDLLVEALSALSREETPGTSAANSPSPPERKSCPAPKIFFHHGQVEWSRCSAEQVYNQWRALAETIGVYSYFQGRRVILKRLRPLTAEEVKEYEQPLSTLQSPGQFILLASSGGDNTSHTIIVAAAAAHSKTDESSNSSQSSLSFLLVERLQVPSKKELSALDFFNGLRLRRSNIHTFLTDRDPVSHI